MWSLDGAGVEPVLWLDGAEVEPGWAEGVTCWCQGCHLWILRCVWCHYYIISINLITCICHVQNWGVFECGGPAASMPFLKNPNPFSKMYKLHFMQAITHTMFKLHNSHHANQNHSHHEAHVAQLTSCQSKSLASSCTSFIMQSHNSQMLHRQITCLPSAHIH